MCVRVHVHVCWLSQVIAMVASMHYLVTGSPGGELHVMKLTYKHVTYSSTAIGVDSILLSLSRLLLIFSLCVPLPLSLPLLSLPLLSLTLLSLPACCQHGRPSQSVQCHRACAVSPAGADQRAGVHGEGDAHPVLPEHEVQAAPHHLLPGRGQRGTVSTGKVWSNG